MMTEPVITIYLERVWDDPNVVPFLTPGDPQNITDQKIE